MMKFQGNSEPVSCGAGNSSGGYELSQGVRPGFKCGQDVYGFI
jgi:hypothetical protein